MKAKIIKLPDGKTGHIYASKQPVEDRVLIYLVDEENRFIINGAGRPATIFKRPDELKGIKVIGFMD